MIWVGTLGGLLLTGLPCWAQGRAALARKTAEYLAQKFGLRAAPGELSRLASRLEQLAAQHGDEAFMAARKVGPNLFYYVEQAGEHGAQAIPEGFPWVITGRKGPWGLRPILSVPGSGQVRLFFSQVFWVLI
jgi:hypothetical protein